MLSCQNKSISKIYMQFHRWTQFPVHHAAQQHTLITQTQRGSSNFSVFSPLFFSLPAVLPHIMQLWSNSHYRLKMPTNNSKPQAMQYRPNWILIVGNPCTPGLYEMVVKRQSTRWSLLSWFTNSPEHFCIRVHRQRSNRITVTLPDHSISKKANHHHQRATAELRSFFFFKNLSSLLPHQREDIL